MTLGRPWPILRQNQHWLLALKLEIIIALSLKVGWSIQLNEIKVQGHSLTFGKGDSDFKIKTCFSQKQLGHSNPNFIWKLMGEWEW